MFIKKSILAVTAVLSIGFAMPAYSETIEAIAPKIVEAEAVVAEEEQLIVLPKIGEMAPNFVAKDTNGNEVSLEALKGKIVVLEWTNHECPFVVKHYSTGNMQSLQAKASEMGVVWLSIVSSATGKQGATTAEEANAVMVEKNSKPAHRILDPEGSIGHLYGAKTTPHMFVVDAEGKLAYQGAIDDNPSPRQSSVEGAKNYVLEAMTALVEGKEIEKSITKPYGCGVKY